MPKFSRFNRSAMFVIVWSVGVGAILLSPHAHAVGSPAPQEPVSSRHAKALARPNPDLSGHKRVGEASFYSKKSTGKKMADGTAMRPHGNNAASKTLPLGTTAFLFLRYLSYNYEEGTKKELGRDYPNLPTTDKRTPLSVGNKSSGNAWIEYYNKYDN